MRKDEPGFFITVDREAPETVYVQVAQQIRERIASGALRPGTLLPPVRTLASDLGYNLNTVARAYRLLEDEGFVRIRDRSGVEVASPASAPSSGARERLGRELREALARLRQAGVKPDEIRRIVEREIAALGGANEKGG